MSIYTIRSSFARLGTAAYLLATAAAFAQFPGMEESDTETARAAAAAAAVPPTAPPEGILGYWHKFMGPESPYRAVILTVVTLIVVLRVRSYLTKIVKGQVTEKAFEPDNAQTFLKVWNAIWKFIVAVLVIIAMSGSLKLLGLTAGFLGMMLGWSLQQPVTGIAAWLMIILKKPFQIGDRVVIAGVTGDVTGISLTHVVLNQVGGSIGGEERSGRGILIPNAILFQHIIINYTLEQKHMLDEVPVRLSFNADWDLAKKLMIEAAREGTKELMAETDSEPFVRCEFLDWGMLVRLRYQTDPVRRQEISTNVIEILLRKFKDNYPRVSFAYPTSRVHYHSGEGAANGDMAPPFSGPPQG